jgi:hypothetical protein
MPDEKLEGTKLVDLISATTTPEQYTAAIKSLLTQTSLFSGEEIAQALLMLNRSVTEPNSIGSDFISMMTGFRGDNLSVFLGLATSWGMLSEVKNMSGRYMMSQKVADTLLGIASQYS